MACLARRLGFRLAERMKGMRVGRYLDEYLANQWLAPDEIRRIQESKLAGLIEHAYQTVPFYRELMDERGLAPSDVRSLGDLAKLPILTKETIRANYPEKTISSSFAKSDLVDMTSSGSTGEPFRYVITNDEKAKKWSGLYLFWSWAGYEMGDRIVNLTASPPRAFKENKLAAFLETRFSGILGLPANELYASNAGEFVERIVAFQPKTLRGYASSLYYLAQVMSEKGVKMSVNSVCSTGETLFDFQRELMESFYGCKVQDGYGGEGMEIAAQCGEGSYHVNAENVILETVDVEGKACGPGVEGQVVLTDLNHYSMPFIRYNIQDVAVRSDETCPCGRGLPMLSRLSGRLADIGVTPSGKSIHVHFFTALFMKLAPKVKTFQVIQELPDLFVIKAVPGEGYESAIDEIISKTQDYVGPEVKVELQRVDEIPITKGGKRRLFISKCGIKAAGADSPEDSSP